MAKRAARPVTSRWEWVAAALSLVIVLALVAILGWQLVTPSTPPELHAVVDSVSAQRGQYLVHFTVRNAGTESAANVLVEGTLQLRGDVVEAGSARLDYVPGQARRGGGLVFTRDPGAHELRVTARGYERP